VRQQQGRLLAASWRVEEEADVGLGCPGTALSTRPAAEVGFFSRAAIEQSHIKPTRRSDAMPSRPRREEKSALAPVR
jgi:hypothetical protein